MCGLSILYSIIYQYISLIKSPEIFKNPKIFAAMYLSMIVYPIPMLSLYVINVDFEAGKAYVIENYPYLSTIYVPKSCNTILVNYTMYAYMISGIIEISTIYIIGITLFIKIHKQLVDMRHSLSATTLKARKQYVRALIIQATVPLVFIVIPITGIMFSVVIGMAKAEGKFDYL
uniref:Uncharacterized protein n=1 Tax=Panagrolaimus superbus TaxID=310955 RepID=A0A914YHQ4_9BILA